MDDADTPQLLSSNIFYTEKSSKDTSFFDTIDDSLEQSDITRILNTIIKKYPTFSPYNKDVKQIKETFLQILENERFVNAILDYYGITIQQFFRYLGFMHFNLFKGSYLKKVQRIVVTKSYFNRTIEK